MCSGGVRVYMCVRACVRACVRVCGRACVRVGVRACVRACVCVCVGGRGWGGIAGVCRAESLCEGGRVCV